MMLAVSFFLKYAFDNDWVGPTGRVVIGLVWPASGLLVLSEWLLGRGYRYFSEGIAALGGGVLFLSLYAAWAFYALVPMAVAFAGMVVATVALAALALRRGSQRMAILALAAGMTTPALLLPDNDQPNIQFTYLAILSGGFLAVGLQRIWRWLGPLAFVGTVVYFGAWYVEQYTEAQLLPTCLVASLFFLLFGSYSLLRTRGSRLNTFELLLPPVNALWYGFVLFLTLYQDHRWWLTGALLVLAALHLAAARAVPEGIGRTITTARFVFYGLALVLATAAIPVRLEGHWVVVLLALEGAAIVWSGARGGLRALRATGAMLLLIDVLVLLDLWEATDTFLANHRFAAFAVLVLAMAMSVRWVGALGESVSGNERNLFGLVATVGFVVAVWGMSEELWNFLGRQTWGLDPALARQMGLSLLWAVAAGLLIFTGVRGGLPGRRRLGLALLGVVVLKVFLLDLSFLDRAYRIASFFVLGIVLLLVSFWYQRSLAEGRDEADDST